MKKVVTYRKIIFKSAFVDHFLQYKEIEIHQEKLDS